MKAVRVALVLGVVGITILPLSARANETKDLPNLGDFAMLNYWAAECQTGRGLIPAPGLKETLNAVYDEAIADLGPSKTDANIRTVLYPLMRAGSEKGCDLVVQLYGPSGSYRVGWLRTDAVE